VTSIQDLGLAVKRLQWRHHRTANTRLAAIGTSLAQWDVLRQLHAHPQASLHDLALLTFQTDQSMGSLAARMVDHGLLDRVDGPGRAVRHHLTDDGARVLDVGGTVMDGVLAETVGRLSADERATLLALLTRATD